VGAPSPLAPGTILGLAGSPRRDGNSERFLDACLNGARDAGAPVLKVPVVEFGIEPCRGCNACSLTGECVIRDRMDEVYAMLDAAAAIVVSTPVFFATVPAVLKALYDRCQPYWARRYQLGLPAPQKRPGGLLVVRAGGDPFGHECAVSTTRSVYAVLGLTMDAPLVIQGVDSPSDIGRHPEELAAAAALGSEIARATRR